MLLELDQNALPRETNIDYDTYASPYLDNAWNPDRFDVIALKGHPSGMELRLRIVQYHGQGQMPFHLSNIAAAVWIQQMGVVFARWLDGDTDKSSFVDMVEFSIRCNKPIRDTDELVIRGTLERSRRLKQGRLYLTRFSVQDDRYTGQASFYYAGKNSLKSIVQAHRGQESEADAIV